MTKEVQINALGSDSNSLTSEKGEKGEEYIEGLLLLTLPEV